jgi:hypothetical protein
MAAPAAPAAAWPLGPELTVAIFLRLPSQARLCARVVCRDWHATLSDPALWRAVDVSAAVDRFAPPYLPLRYHHLGHALEEFTPRATASALFAGAARSRGTLHEADVSGCVPRRLRFARLLDFTRRHAASLRVLRAARLLVRRGRVGAARRAAWRVHS